jgi:sarcosine oxidase, subunit delta
MLLVHCPYCDETLPELEFTYGGEAHIARPENPADKTDDEWRDFLFIRTNVKGPHFERWRHAHGCGRFFNAVRDTVSDRFLTTYKADAPRPDLAVLLADASTKEPSK